MVSFMTFVAVVVGGFCFGVVVRLAEMHMHAERAREIERVHGRRPACGEGNAGNRGKPMLS